jgi:tRNA (adenine57-N1/adenine58-N1)-methyltransferase catalytic subunit
MLLLLSGDENHLVRPDKDINTKSGIVKSSGLKVGRTVKTHIGKVFAVVNPNVNDVLRMGMKRTAQVILPKDLALVLGYTGIACDSKIVDAGTGTGYAAIFLANYAPKGKIVTYESNKVFRKVAKRNIEFSGFTNIQLRSNDVTVGIKERDTDLVLLDLQGADKAVKHAHKSLKLGGYLVVYSPTVEHLKKSLNAIYKKGFIHIKTVENIVREWQTERTTRPKTIGLMHTGFLTFARKV